MSQDLNYKRKFKVNLPTKQDLLSGLKLIPDMLVSVPADPTLTDCLDAGSNVLASTKLTYDRCSENAKTSILGEGQNFTDRIAPLTSGFCVEGITDSFVESRLRLLGIPEYAAGLVGKERADENEPGNPRDGDEGADNALLPVLIYLISQTDTKPSCVATANRSEEWFHAHEKPASLVDVSVAILS
jgi:hypothetical protein